MSPVRRAKSCARRDHREPTFDDLLHEIRGGNEGLPDVLRKVCSARSWPSRRRRRAGRSNPGADDLRRRGPRSRRSREQTIRRNPALKTDRHVPERPRCRGSRARIRRGLSGPASAKPTATCKSDPRAIDLELRYASALGAPFSERAIEMLLHDASVVGLSAARQMRRFARDLIERNREAVEDRIAAGGRGYRRRPRSALLQQYPVSAETAPFLGCGR